MSRTLLICTHFSQIRYQIKTYTQMHMAKDKELFLCLLFLRYSNFFLVRRNFFGGEFMSNLQLTLRKVVSRCPLMVAEVLPRIVSAWLEVWKNIKLKNMTCFHLFHLFIHIFMH